MIMLFVSTIVEKYDCHCVGVPYFTSVLNLWSDELVYERHDAISAIVESYEY